MKDINRDMFMGYTYPYMDNNNDLYNRINILERSIRRLEDRINKLEGTSMYNTESYNNVPYNNYPNNMYNMI